MPPPPAAPVDPPATVAPPRFAAPAGPLTLPPGLNVGEAFARILEHHGAMMLHQASRIRPTAEDPEPVHQTRVALRRLRSALAVFSAATATEAVVVLGQDLRALGHRLGPARSWDVFLAGTGQRLHAAFPEEETVTTLLRNATRRRDSAYVALSRDLAGPQFKALAAHITAVADGRGWRDGLQPEQRMLLGLPLDRFGADMLTRLNERVRRRGKRILQLDAVALHNLRLRGKRLRYAAEFFAEQFPPRPTRRYLRRLAALQEQLGVLNDTATTGALMQELRARGRAAGIVLGYTAAESESARALLAEVWKRFRRAEPFWIADEAATNLDAP